MSGICNYKHRSLQGFEDRRKDHNLKTLISTKIELYTSWLLVVDNVTSTYPVHVHLPESGNEQWARGQLLITTQDTASIPLTSSFIQHISVSKASAATYVRQVRQNKATSNFGWNEFLKKLDTGQRGTTEAILAETNPSYQNSMTAATTLAVQKQMTSDKVIDHTFQIPLSVCTTVNKPRHRDQLHSQRR
ncbi:hypothetical protein OS493_032551 [Desmophyllum pertusum]|uniref:Uncharacterized protein n=1 Tax=Desmophyllum pertusum TaxID=174260 RepID=A0A9W9YVZ1_9CNID|nr:hypothetical protein OS493_032551 [Desmophyllum pertusum]